MRRAPPMVARIVVGNTGYHEPERETTHNPSLARYSHWSACDATLFLLQVAVHHASRNDGRFHAADVHRLFSSTTAGEPRPTEGYRAGRTAPTERPKPTAAMNRRWNPETPKMNTPCQPHSISNTAAHGLFSYNAHRTRRHEASTQYGAWRCGVERSTGATPKALSKGASAANFPQLAARSHPLLLTPRRSVVRPGSAGSDCDQTTPCPART
jgi:hypothetical protein